MADLKRHPIVSGDAVPVSVVNDSTETQLNDAGLIGFCVVPMIADPATIVLANGTIQKNQVAAVVEDTASISIAPVPADR